MCIAKVIGDDRERVGMKTIYKTIVKWINSGFMRGLG